MSKDAAEEIVKGRATGQKVWGEVVAGAIGLTDEKWFVPLISSLSCLLFHRAEGTGIGQKCTGGLDICSAEKRPVPLIFHSSA